MTLTELKQQVIKIASGDAPDESPTAVFSRLGFDKYHTGGGCMSLAVFNADDSHILITDKDGDGIPETMSDVMVGEYDSNGDPVGDVWESPFARNLGVEEVRAIIQSAADSSGIAVKVTTTRGAE